MSGRFVRDTFDTLSRQAALKKWLYSLENKQWTTFGDARVGAARAARQLAAAGVREGERFAILLPNCVEFFYFLLAAMFNKQIAVLLNPELHPREVENLLLHSQCKVLVSNRSIEGRLGASIPQACARICIDDDAGAPGELEGLPLDPKDPYCILYTSGTFGDPKGVVLTHGNIGAAVDAISSFYGFTEELRMFAVVPFCSVLGLVVNGFVPLECGGQTVFSTAFRPYDAGPFWERLAEHRITHFCAVPSIIRLLSKFSAPDGRLDLSRLQHGFCSTAPLFSSEQASFEERFNCRLVQCYGLTETTAWCTLGTPHGDRLLGSVGRPWQCELKIMADARTEVIGREVGEVWVRSTRVMQGYYRNPRATADVLEDDWLRTGDMGWMHEGGELFLVGRSKQMIARGGFKVHPLEIDEALASHPDVLESATVGEADAVRGEAIHTYVVLRTGTASVALLRMHLRERIAGYKMPDTVSVVTALPRGATGKIRLRDLRSVQPGDV